VIPLEEYDADWYSYPDEKVVTLCTSCHGATEYQQDEEKWPINGRGDEAKLDRLANPKSEQTTLDEYE
jgi:cytochrome c553